MEQGLFDSPLAGVNRLDYLSPSKMSLLLENPRKFFRKYAPGHFLEDEETRSLKIGDYAHTALFKPKEWANYREMETFSGTGSKAAKQAWIASLPEGVKFISADDREKVKRMVDAAMKDREARELIETIPGHAEVAAYAKRPDGIWLHGRIDRLIAGPGVVEYKTTSGAVDWDEFVWQVFEYDYHLALATYIEIVSILEKKPVTQSAWLVQQQVEPYSVRVHYPEEEDMLDIGRFDMERAIERWKMLTKKDPGLANESVWFGARQESEEAPCKFPYHVLIRRPEWHQFLTGVK